MIIMSSSIHEEAEKLKGKIENEQKEKLKIALFGQPGAGKSSLINAIVGKRVANTGASTDVTTTVQIIEHNDLLLVDLPGYGTSKFPPNQWFQEFNPEQYDLFLCVFSGKFHEGDTTFFKQLNEKGKVCLFVRNKKDDIWEDEKNLSELLEEIEHDVQKQVGSAEKVFFVSCKRKEGLSELMDGISNALEPAKREKYNRSAKAYTIAHLEKKKAACEKIVYSYAGLAVANGLNPVPGLNVGVDIGLMIKLFKDIRDAYGLSDAKLNSLSSSLFPIAKNVLDFATKDGVLILLKQFSGREIVRQTSVIIPIIGPIIAASIGFGMTLGAGKAYLNDCHKLAEKILEEDLAIVAR